MAYQTAAGGTAVLTNQLFDFNLSRRVFGVAFCKLRLMLC